jgi:UDP-N-acetylmuramoylalanine--D-glutamate ligase
MRPILVVGLGVTGTAVARALVRRNEPVVAVDDTPGVAAQRAAQSLGIELLTSPERDRLTALVGDASAVVPAPGLPARHPVFDAAKSRAVPVLSEFDLAARWDDRPVLAITGTDGKTTVTTLARAMLEASGRTALAVGNTETPLIAAIDDPTIDVFVVEASSFRLAHSRHFAPAVGTWLNFAPDHLDNHRSLEDYRAAKARIWRDQSSDQVAIGNADDAVVSAELERAPGRRLRFGVAHRGMAAAGSGNADMYRVVDGVLVTSDQDVICGVGELRRRLPHDVLNGLAAAATAHQAGATLDGLRAALLGFDGLPHTLELVGEADSVRYYDDSKATTPHATLTAISGFESVVLICGGRNKALDLRPLAAGMGSIRAVVAIGEAADLVKEVFNGRRPVQVATSMDDAVVFAASLARPGDTVLLSPGCASHDWYSSYRVRGDDFRRAVAQHTKVGS